MPEDFVPSTDMERAYVQARSWHADRAWKRAYTQVSERKLAMGVGMYLCLLDYYARRDGIRELFETCEWILTNLANLRPAESLSVCKIVCNVVKTLKEDEFDVRETRLKLILRIPLAVILDAVAEQRLSCALTGLLEFSRVFEESVTIKQCSDLQGDFLGAALAIDRTIRAGAVRDKLRASESLTRAEYDRERMEAINMADAIKDKLSKEVSAPWHGSDPTSIRGFLKNELPGWVESWNSETHESEQTTTAVESASSAHNKRDDRRLLSPRSSEVTRSLASFIEIKSEQFQSLSVFSQIETLKDIAIRGDAKLPSYVMSILLSIIGTANERNHLLSLMTIFEKSLFERREANHDFDVCLGLALWRLIYLWRESETLVEGQAYCDLLLQRLVRIRGLDDSVVRQISSAAAFLVKARRAAEALSARGTNGESKAAINESVEFASMLTAYALHEFRMHHLESVRLILNELLKFYSDAKDGSWRTGQMLWLVQETALHKMRMCTLTLVEKTVRESPESILHWRDHARLKRLMERIDDSQHRELLSGSLLMARHERGLETSQAERLQITRELFALGVNVRDFDSEAKDERVRIEEEHASAEVQGESKSATLRRSKSRKLLLELEALADKNDWKGFLETWRSASEQLSPADSIYRLAQLGLLAVRSERADICERVILLLQNYVSPTNIHVLNFLSEECAKHFVGAKNPQRAAEQLERALSNKHQLGDFCNCLRLQLAELYVAMGNFFEATVLIYEAYSNIPDSDIGGAKQMLLGE